MSRIVPARRQALKKVLFPFLFLVAGLSGGYAAAHLWPLHEEAADLHPHGHSHEADQEEDEHVSLTKQAFRNLGLTTGKVSRSNYFRMATIPCEVVERRGLNSIVIAAPVNGVVTRVHAFEGQAIRPGDALFDLGVTDEALTSAQIELLDVNAQLRILEVEASRLAPLAESGVVAGSRKLKLDYEKEQLIAKRQLRIQELQVRGLTRAQVDAIVDGKLLVREFTVRLSVDQAGEMPELTSIPCGDDAPSEPSPESDDLEFSVERLNVFPGKSVTRGEDMCTVAYHTQLLVKGFAYDNDIENIALLEQRGWKVSVELGIEGSEFVRANQSVLYVDNHVDVETQTFPFYITLKNDVIEDSIDQNGRVYRAWRFKPGQRGHVIVPVERYSGQFKLPLDAVAQEGPNAFVFRKHSHSLPGGSGSADGESDIYIEFEPVPVHILHRDSEYVVIADDGQMRVGEVVALNNAYKLNLAMKVQSGGGGGHNHDHGH